MINDMKFNSLTGCVPSSTIVPNIFPNTTTPYVYPETSTSSYGIISQIKKKLIIVGAGGHGRDVYGIVRKLQEIDFVGFLDDNFDKYKGEKEYLGEIKEYPMYMGEHGKDLYYVIAINDSKVRRDIDKRMATFYAKPLTIIHPSAVVSNLHDIGPGSVLGPLAVVTENVKLGRHVHLNTAASVNQGSRVADYCTLSPGARVCGDVTVGEATMLGANSTIINLINVGSEVVIGAGGVVVADIPSGVVAKGVPARYDS